MIASDVVRYNSVAVERYLTVGDIENARSSACKVVKNIFEAPALGLDLDGTIDEASEFFSFLSKTWPGLVYIVTFRSDAAKAVADALSYGIVFDELITVRSLNDKSRVIREKGIKIYYDDQDECLQDIAEDVTVFKIRNGGNFVGRKWLYSDDTGRRI